MTKNTEREIRSQLQRALAAHRRARLERLERDESQPATSTLAIHQYEPREPEELPASLSYLGNLGRYEPES